VSTPLTPAERVAASETIRRQDKRIETLVKAAMTCTNCGARLKCEWCGHDPHAAAGEVKHE